MPFEHSSVPTTCPQWVRCPRIVLALCSVFLLPFFSHTRPYKVWYGAVVLTSEEWELGLRLVRQHKTLLRTVNKS